MSDREEFEKWCNEYDKQPWPDSPKGVMQDAWQARANIANAREKELLDSLEEILCCHDGNQPPALNMPDLDYARRVIWEMHTIANKALTQHRTEE